MTWFSYLIKLSKIYYNFIPHETITYTDKYPPWIDKSIRRLIQEKDEA